MKSSFMRGRYRLLTGVAGSMALLFASAGLAQAQDAAAEEEASSEIVVTGFRASLANSTNIKRNSGSIVEAVSAEDIGRLPDNSIAESLARLPGLTAQRLFGRAQVISVRGLSADFTTALLNGREQVSAGDNRGVEFDQYPSELLSSVLVYKTPDGALIGQGLAGTADMRTVRPLAQGERTFSVSSRYEWNEIGALNAGSDDDGYRITGAYIDQSADGHWGWAIGAAITSSPTQAERWESWGYDTVDGTFPLSDPIPSGVRLISGAKPYVQSSVLERDGYFGTLEFAPNNSFHSTIDVFYSEFDEVQTLRGIEFPFRWDCAYDIGDGDTDTECGATTQDDWVVQDGLVTSVTFNPVEAVVRNDVRSRHSIVQAIGWGTEFSLNADWTAKTDLSYSSVERNDLDLELWAGTAAGGGTGATDSFSVDLNDGPASFVTPSLDYADPTTILLTDPRGWGSVGFIKEPQTDDQLTALRLSASRSYDAPVFNNAEFGVNYSEREKDKTSIEAYIDLANPGLDNAVELPEELRLEPTSLGFINIPATLSFDPLAALAYPGLYVRRSLTNDDVLAKAWHVEEQVTTFYGKLGIDTTMFSLPLTGNVGFQLVRTDQSSTGAAARNTNDTNPSPFTINTDGASYTEFLPSANFAFQLSDNQYLRLGVARTLARPRMDEMRASFQVDYNLGNINSTNVSQSYWGGSGGNPRLRPWIAKSFDLSYEAYFGGAGYVAAAVFHKDLETYIYTQNVLQDFTGFPTLNPDDDPAIYQGVVSLPQNGEGGRISGVELTASIPGDLIAPFLSGFGVIANAAFTDSSIEPNGPGTETPLPGLSEQTANLTVYYEIGGFEARLSNRYRSDFLGEVTGFGAGRELRQVHGESVLDGQMGYRFGDGPLEGLSILFQANNITDEPFSTFTNDDERQIRDYQSYGSTYLVGLTYRR